MTKPEAQQLLPIDQVEATKRTLARLHEAAERPAPTLEQLAALREELKARAVEDDVKIVKLDGPMQLWSWLCKRHRESLKPGWFVAEPREAPHPLVCEKCAREP